MNKKAKIIATLGPAIHDEKKLKNLVESGVDAFRINFSHNTKGIKKIVSRIRKVENQTKKRLSIIADLQGVKLRIGEINSNFIRLKPKQKFTFDSDKKIGDQYRVCFPYPAILKKLKKGNRILLDDGKFSFKIIKKLSNAVLTVSENKNCIISSNKSIHLQNFFMPFNNLTSKDKKDIKSAKKLGCNWIALSYIQNAKLIYQTRKLINNDMGIICKIENKTALKNINEIINATDSIMIARGDLAIDIGHSDVPQVQLDLIKRCSQYSKPVIVATQMLESMIESNVPTRAEINDVATAIFQGADVVMLSAETAVGKYPLQTVKTMSDTIISTEKYKKQHIGDFKNKVNINKDPRKSVVLSVKDLAYNPTVKAIIAFSNSGSTAKLVSTMRPSVKIITISPNINVSRQTSLYWGVESINSRDAHGWKDMMNISKQIIKKDKLIKKNDNVIITAGLPFGQAKMTNMIRFFKVGS
jgi:pyruvate kinase|tara:strand:+ start:394 stop:1806 length:1413 start_codon:yes stop_codon:yes gene_type:complete